jgi:hypothetical protein
VENTGGSGTADGRWRERVPQRADDRAGEFVPGFTAVDKQIQILAYALVFGFAQQLFIQVVGQRARRLVSNVPTKARGISAPDREMEVPQCGGQPSLHVATWIGTLRLGSAAVRG